MTKSDWRCEHGNSEDAELQLVALAESLEANPGRASNLLLLAAARLSDDDRHSFIQTADMAWTLVNDDDEDEGEDDL